MIALGRQMELALSSTPTARVIFAMARARWTKARSVALRFAVLQQPQHGTEFSLV